MTNNSMDPNSDPLASEPGPLGLVTEAARRGAADASEAAGRTCEAAGRFLKRLVYTTCYTVSYGVVFPSVLLARAIPRDNAAVRGLTEGADAARSKVDALFQPSPAALGGPSLAGVLPA